MIYRITVSIQNAKYRTFAFSSEKLQISIAFDNYYMIYENSKVKSIDRLEAFRKIYAEL